MSRHPQKPKRPAARGALSTETPVEHAPSPLRQWLAVGMLVALSFVAYANSLGGDFVLDSKVLVLEDPRIREATSQNLRLIFTESYWWPYTAQDNLYRPVTTLSYLVNATTLGSLESPTGFHAVNVLLHATNVILAFLLALRLSRRYWLSAGLAALWAVHPLTTEAVANIVGRADLLAGAGVLGALYAYVRSSEAAGRPRMGWLALAASGATFGMFAKESAVVIFGLVVLYDLALRPPRISLLSRIPGWLAMAVPVLVLFAVRSAVLGGTAPPDTLAADNPIVLASFWTGRLTALAVLGRYVWLTLWPLTLSADYSYAQVPLVSGALVDFAAWATVLASVLLLARSWRWNRLVFFAGALAFAAILPASNLLVMSGTIMAERLAYLTVLGLLACGVAAIAAAARAAGRPAAAYVVLAALIIAAAGRTVARNTDWETDLSLWTATVQAAPMSFKAHQGLAQAIYDSDPDKTQLPRVVEEVSRSLALLEPLPPGEAVWSTFRLAAVWPLELGDRIREENLGAGTDESTRAYERARDAARRFVETLEAGGPAATAGRLPGSDRSRELGDANLLLATIELRLGEFDASATAARRAQGLMPLNAQTYRPLASALIGGGRFDEAAIVLLTGFTVAGDQDLRSAAMALYETVIDPGGCAVISSGGGRSLNGNCGIVVAHMCAASVEAARIQESRGRKDLADSARQMAAQTFGCSLDPASPRPAP